MSPDDDAGSGITAIEPSDATVPDKLPYSDDCSDGREDQIRCIASLNHNAVEIFDPYPAEILFNVQIMSQTVKNQQMVRFNCRGDMLPQITMSRPSVPVATLPVR
jgi:hypothetical protein